MRKSAMPEKEIGFKTRILKYGKKGEKSGWTYIDIPTDIAEKLSPGTRKSFRVKGKLDDHSIAGIALIPVGEGNFILPLNVSLRKAIGKREGAMLSVLLRVDNKKPTLSKELLLCLGDEPEALRYFMSMSPSHRNYYSKWIEDAKTPITKASRIARTVNALLRKMNYGEMLRAKI